MTKLYLKTITYILFQCDCIIYTQSQISMSLADRDKERRQFLENQIKTVNLDMSILNGISGKNVGTETMAVQKPPKLTLNQLAQVLKNKTDKSAYLQSQKHQVKEWLKDKGVNLKKINQQINQNVRVSAELGIFVQPKQPEIKPMGISVIRKKSVGQAPQKQPTIAFTQDFQSKFINKQKQVTLNREIVKSMKQSRQKNNFRSMLINKIKQSLPINEAKNKSLFKQKQPQLQNKTMLSISRDEELMKEETRKNQYFDFVQSLTNNGFKESVIKLKQVRPFWKIVLQHLKTIQHYRPILEQTKLSPSGTKDPIQLKLNSCMMYKSLKMIEHQFSKELPDTFHNYEKLDEIIKNMEKRNRKLKVWRNSNGEPSWGRAYMLLRAGRRDEVKRVLEGVDKEFLNDLLFHEQSLNKTPTPSYTRHQPSKYKDSFYTQLLNLLQANQQFEPQLIVEDQLLTKTWIMLRTLGVYRQNPDIQVNYQKIGKSIAAVESKSIASLNRRMVENFLYLGLYRNLVYVLEMALDHQIEKQLEGISYDDYFHLLMVVSIYPELWGDSSKKQRIGLEAKFVQQLSQYIIKLRNDGFTKQTSKYLILSPINNLPEVAGHLITTRQHYQQFDWHSFKNLLRIRHPQRADDIYIHLTKSILDSLKLKTFKDFMQAAELYRTTFGMFEDAFYHEQKCYVKLLLKHLFFVEKKRYLLRKQQLGPQFTDEMFAFFEIDAEEQRDQGKLMRIDEEVKVSVNECEMMLQKYVDFEATDQEYEQNILRPYLFYQTVNELAKLLQNPMSNIQELKNFDNTLMYKNLKTPAERIGHNLNLFQYFRSEFDNHITSLYVFYLSMLVERKQIISSKECDYSGLPAFVEGVLGNLEAMDRACEARVERVKQKKFADQQERRKAVEENFNKLELCHEYREFREEMYEYLRQYGGTYGMGLDGINNDKLLHKTTRIVG